MVEGCPCQIAVVEGCSGQIGIVQIAVDEPAIPVYAVSRVLSATFFSSKDIFIPIFIYY